MASTQDTEVQFAQRLASNEKPIRTKALKKLRKYISVRSQKDTGGFTGDELLKLWKGLFYCLWMQDKPLLQEQLSNQISTLIHSFHNLNGQMLYLESFLQTFKREWTGIDRLRMDKFFQLVRFMFKQTFELLKKRNWDSSVVGRFLELLTTQLLQSDSAAPSELQLHILDLYLTELAAVGSAELTAEQNLVFIEPFCNKAAETKDQILFGAICSSIFSTIINQAPFAIEDLIKEVKALESDSDSGQASAEDDDDDGDQIQKKRSLGPVNKEKQVNGCKSKDEGDDFDHLEDLDPELPCDNDDDIGPVLQFDYAAVADKLLELASQSSSPSYNRQKLYSIIKVLRDLSEGIFPQDECPEDESTDEDEDMFGSRKKMKRVVAPTEGEEGAPSAKKRRKKKAAAISNDDGEQAELSTNDQKRKKRKRRRNKKASQGAGDEECSGTSNTSVPAETLLHSEKLVLEEAILGQSQPPTTKKKKGEKGKEWQKVTAQPEEASVADASFSKKGSQEGQKPTRPASVEAPHKETKKKKKAVNGKPGGRQAESDANGLISDDGLPPPQSEVSATKKKKRRKTEEEGKPAETWHHSTTTPGEKAEDSVLQEEKGHMSEVTNQSTKKKRRLKQKEQDIRAGVETTEGQDAETITAPPTRKKKSKEGRNQVVSETPSSRKTPKKRKIPVTFEYEAEELEEAGAKDVGGPSSTPSANLNKAKPASHPMSDFITFQSNVSVPTPLFCKAKGGPSTPLARGKKCQTPKSDSKKVTFGLKSNKTAEFKKTDRSLLVSPDGSSRVAFDPKQKPKFGVLKSPSIHKVKSSSCKRRPSAADFF
ncbi:ribosomal RNA processing protein 1 homolog A-like isoform X2 [Betta splendens]|uniref:Ribosomal RNA processing protein 1 homolog A-like isoform X2 n=1 Tax=Betta splendens TaxID=158456 RepID=A0A6P7LEU6_BETSP|nr:ribosomal RNA processing protein 1 homolog A-like isoform X2 [Betta splendens]